MNANCTEVIYVGFNVPASLAREDIEIVVAEPIPPEDDAYIADFFSRKPVVSDPDE